MNSIVFRSPELQLILELAVEGFRLMKNWRLSIYKTQGKSSTQMLSEFSNRIERRRNLDYISSVAAPYEVEYFEQVVNGRVGYESTWSEYERKLIIWDPHVPVVEETASQEPPVAALISKITYQIDSQLQELTWDMANNLFVSCNSAGSRYDFV